MPGFNAKGPDGQGPLTGHRMGKCRKTAGGEQTTETTNENRPMFRFKQRGHDACQVSGRRYGRGGQGQCHSQQANDQEQN